MIDLTTIRTYQVDHSLAELHELNVKLMTKNGNLRNWLIGAAVVVGFLTVVVFIQKSRNNEKTKERNS
jgi:hypothetical protein